ncbi:MAG: SpoIIE family protein phosphatase [Paludibacteraceae bacterium]|nr:SpoIIE family protein phosphatase [Paludibacteraceae bacterium]
MSAKKWYNEILIMVIAAVVLEGTACVQYFTSRAAIKREAMQRAESELRKAELEIDAVTTEMEAATKMLVAIAEQHIDNPDSIALMTRVLLETIDNVSSASIGFIADYFPREGRWYEVCTSREGDGLLYTREIGSAEHDYLQMDWFQDGLKIDSCWWTEPYYDDSGAKAMIVSCTHPIRNHKGEIVAVACIDLSLEYLDAISQYLRIYENSYYSISSNKGLDIISSNDTVAGKKYYIFHEDIDATGWQIEIIIPDEVLFAELRRTGLIITLMMILGLAVLAFILVRSTNTTKRLIVSTEKNERMESELHIARTIQMAMLPKVFPPFTDRPDVNIYGIVDPAKEIGGDLYDFYVRHDKVFFCVGDVSGKGVPASLVMAMTRSLFRSVTSHNEDAAGIVSEMNTSFVEQNTQNMFLTLFVGVLDTKTGKLTYCNAGHCAPVMVTGYGLRVTGLEVIPNLPLGIVADYKFKAQTTKMNKDDVIFLYTDGLTEAENSTHEQYGEKRMMEAIKKISSNRPREIIEAMKASVTEFVAGAEQSDDLTMMAVRYQHPAIVMKSDVQQIPTLAEWVDSLGIPDELNMQVNLALEEAVSNVMLYAYPGGEGQVFVEFNRGVTGDGLQVTGERLVFTITDGGIAFDPTKKAEADITLSAEDREIGGLGIHLVRQIMDEIRYRREENCNVLTMVKTVKSED